MKRLTSQIAFLLWAGLLSGGYVLAALHKDAPFSAYAEWLSIGLGFYLGKRVGKFMVSSKYNNSVDKKDV